MANLSITTAWNETVAFVKREGRLLFPIAFLLIALPGALLQVAMPTAPAPGTPPEAGPWLLMFPVAIVASLIGTIAICFLALRPGASVGEALQTGLRRFLILFAAALLIGVAAMILALPLILLVGASIAQGSPNGAMAAGAVLIALVLLCVYAFFWVRLMLMTAVAAVEPGGPIALLSRSWTLTRGHFWKLLGFILLVLVAAIVIMFAVSILGGILVFLVAGRPDPDSLAMFLLLLLSALLQAILSTFFATLTARIYAQLAGGAAPDVFA